MQKNAGKPIAVKISVDMQQELTILAAASKTNFAYEARCAILTYIMHRMADDDLTSLIKERRDRLDAVMRGILVEDKNAVAPADRAGHSLDKEGPIVQVSVRMDDTMRNRLTALALLDDDSVADQMRRAFCHYITEMQTDSVVAPNINDARTCLPKPETGRRSVPGRSARYGSTRATELQLAAANGDDWL